MRRLWKRTSALTAYFVLSTVILSGCTGIKPQIVETQQPEKTAITLLASQNWIKDIDRQLFREFEEETGIEVELLLTPDNGYEELWGNCMSGGNEAVDIFMGAAGSGFMQSGIRDIVVDLTEEEWVNDMEDWALESVSYEDKVLGFNTWAIDYEGILYNKTYFNEQGLEVPATWEEFLTLCGRICDLGSVPLYEGINSSWHTRSWINGLTPALYREIPDLPGYLNAGTEHGYRDIDAFRKGLEQIQELFSAKENGRPRYYISDGKDEEFQGSYEFLTERKTIMMFTYSAYAGELEDYGSQDEWGMFPVPLLDNRTAVSNGGGMARYINKKSKHIEECKELFRFLAREENLERYYEARSDFAASAFQDVKAVHPTDAMLEILERSEETPVVMLEKDVYYIDPHMYQYIRGFADGTCSVEEFIRNCDSYREKMLKNQRQ